jgi:hypothetical protein
MHFIPKEHLCATENTVFCLKCNPTTHKPFHTQNNTANSNIEFLQLYPAVAADALLAVGMALISAALSLNEHLSWTLLMS